MKINNIAGNILEFIGMAGLVVLCGIITAISLVQ